MSQSSSIASSSSHWRVPVDRHHLPVSAWQQQQQQQHYHTINIHQPLIGAYTTTVLASVFDIMYRGMHEVGQPEEY